MARSGGFDRLGGVGAQSLDPFGSGRGGLGRYFIGDTVSTIEALERYATSIGWQNGTVTDEAYLDSLRKWVNMSPEGSRDRISAQNTLDDAIYTIGRNKLVRNLNNSATDQDRIGALNALIGYDRQKLATMVGDNEARRELVDRIAGSQADIRGTRWNALVRDYNRHRVSNQAMLNFARTSREQANGAPDQQTWEDRVFEFSERIADDRLQELQQDYEHDRIGGSQVLAFVDARLRGMSRNSPRFADLTRWREDFAVAFRTDERAEQYETTRMDYQSGKISSSEWLRFLSRRVEQTKPGSEERRAAQFQLQMESFNIAEGRLIYDVAVNGTSPDRLIAFYRGALRTMDSGSARALDLQQRIRDLRVGAVNPMDLLGTTPGTSATPRGSIWGDIPGGNTGTFPGGQGRGSGGSGAEAMINAARSYLGVNYRLGQEGANGIDCSGLIYRAFVDSGMGELINDQRKRAAGYENLFAGRGQVSRDRSELQRGDLVVYGGGSHIGIYLGDGKVMSALTTSGVTIHSLNGISVRPTSYILVDYEGTRPNPPPSRNQPNGPRHNQPPNVPQRGETEFDSGGGGNRQARQARNPQRQRDTEAEETPQHSTGRLPVQGDVPGGGRVRERRETTNSIGAGSTVPAQTQDTGGVRQGTPLPGALDSVARELLRQLRAPLTDANVRSVGAWLLVDNGGGTVYNNNPFNVRTPGDLGADANGYGIFSSWQRGVAVAADALTRSQPELVGSLRQGDDAERTVRLVERAGRYDGQMVTTYNGLQPDRPIYGTGNTTPIFNVPQSMADIARNVPDMAELFDVDVANPANVEWFESNVDAMADASRRWQPDEPAPRWRFQTIDGREVWVTYSPEMYDELLNAQIGYAGLSGDPGKALALRNDLVSWRNDVTIDIFDDQMEDFATEESRLISEGRLSEALAVARSALTFAADFMKLPPNTTDQNYSPRRDELDADQWNSVVETLMTRKPQTDDNPLGDALLGLTDPNAETPDGRPALTFDAHGRAMLNPNAAFVTQDADGKLSVQTWRSDPRMFEQTGSRVDAQGNTDFTPRYLDETIALDIGFQVPVRFARGDTISLALSIATTDGYKDPPDNIATPPPVPGQPMGLLEGFGDLLGKWFNSQPGMPNWSTAGLQGDRPQQPRTPAADPGDYQLRAAVAAPLNVPVVRWIGPDGQRYMAYSLGDFQPGAAVLMAPSDFGDTPPRLVLTPGTLTVRNGQLLKPDGTEWDAAKDGYGDFFHWYGQDARDGAGERELGAQGNRFITRTVNADGSINARLTNAERMTVRDPDAILRATRDYQSGQAGRVRVQQDAPWLAASIRGMEGGIFDPTRAQQQPSTTTGATPSAPLMSTVRVGGETMVMNTRSATGLGVFGAAARLNGMIAASANRVAAANAARAQVASLVASEAAERAALTAAQPAVAAVTPRAQPRGVPPTVTVRTPLVAPTRPSVTPRPPVTTRVNLGPSTTQRPGSTAIVRERGETEFD